MKVFGKRREERFFEDRLLYTLSPNDLDSMITNAKDVVIVDLRSAEEYEKAHIPGAVNHPKEKWSLTSPLDRDKTNVMYCYNQQCHLAMKACLEFARKGFRVMELEGGWASWKDAGFKIEEATEMRKAA